MNRQQRRKLIRLAAAKTYVSNWQLSTRLKSAAGKPTPSPNPRKWKEALQVIRRA